MRLTKLGIKNYRSFDATGQTILFPSPHSAFVGKNNAGKTNIFNALNIVLGNKIPSYIRFEENDYFDTTQPIEIQVTISDITQNDKSFLFAIPNLTIPQKGALNKKISSGSAEITFLLRKNHTHVDREDEDSDESKDLFEIKLWGFNVFRKKEDVRKSIVKMLIVPAIRDYKNDLSASRWTIYGQLMKEVLESSPSYSDIKTDLTNLNLKIDKVFATAKIKLIEDAKIVSYVDDINFQLTEDNNPSELLKSLEIFVTEKSKAFNISCVGTGTQSAVIIGILELALKNKSAKAKLFCIEEPEAFIHPHGIRYLGALVKNITKDQNTQVLISTHSLSLTANFEPSEIIRVDKVDGRTIIKQNTSISGTHFRRFIHQDNAELFFSNRVLFVEGATEKHLFCNLDKLTKLNPGDPESINCNFDRINLGVIRLDSADSILNYVKIAKAFDIPYAAILDRDFIDHDTCKALCNELGLTYQITDKPRLINELKTKGIIIISKGETEDIFTDQEIATLAKKPLSEVQSIKAGNPKTSDAFKKIFGAGKAEYSITIADHYLQNPGAHPLEDTIRKIYEGDITNINL